MPTFAGWALAIFGVKLGDSTFSDFLELLNNQHLES
jgi:hypothetical protein